MQDVGELEDARHPGDHASSHGSSDVVQSVLAACPSHETLTPRRFAS